ncbi:MAG: NADH-quinone oxidoreductase subunit C [Elusimicrobia bacterium]|nr:NADH-quinone oxidoreductase subunit C [Elusimicrobiota bacterium]MBK7208387.1 NADH-quinone oxidoreductase subunit C [Elusimicrobiota bacterium]MBK7545147.1 NADH-quinone oxidoreductase subunit C [Elusimicrobiota bacterium]MBK7574668.1 NADH-quinone oxidoreductase subunit C [Elusimicrobiota bacterium]MBK7688759.1 NADH-quinone oxidoreductase subunit C [Elusimicrobiota bacterium]
MDKAALLEQIKIQFPAVEESIPADPKYVRGGDDLWLKVSSTDLKNVSEKLKNELKFDLLNMLTAVDFIKDNKFEVIYQFVRTSAPADAVFLKLECPRSGEPVVPSLAGLYSSADWQERETYDLFGIRFEGHPNPTRILLWEGYPGWPLRKDYVHTPDRYDNGAEIGLPKAVPAAHP